MTKIEELQLGVRAYNCLRRAGIDTIEKLEDTSKDELMRLRNLGKKSYEEIIDSLANYRNRKIIEGMMNTMMMNDLISRSALLAAYDAAHKGPPGGARKLIEEAPSITPSVPEHMNAFEQAYRNGYEAAKRESGWIPVWERLPETIPCNAGTKYSEAIVVLTDNNIVLTAVYDGTDFICDASFWEAEGQNITHWKSVLPLPKPPEDGA